MNAQFDPAFAITVGLEGGYSNVPGDPGGPTKWGITQVVARAHGYLGDMVDLPIETAKMIYRSDYWNPFGLDLVGDQSVGNKIFDSAVNCGVQTTGAWVQRALNALSKNDGRDVPYYPLLQVDGNFGPVSRAILGACLAISPAYVQALLESINCLQGAHYLMDTEANANLRAFYLGWISKRISF